MRELESIAPATRVRSLLLITPILQGFVPSLPALRYVDRLQVVLDGSSDGKDTGPSVLDLIDSVHFGQWSIIDGGRRLLFVSMFVGELEPYLKDFSVRMAWGLDLIWMHCEGYPGAAQFEPFVAWVKQHMVQADRFYEANPGVTVVDIRWWKALHAQFEEFRRKARCGGDIVSLFAELERGIARLSGIDEVAESRFLRSIAGSVRANIQDLKDQRLFAPAEIEPIERNFEQVMATLQGEKS
ncbi:hypothetical protein KEG38_46745 [Polyangium jinanense]|uniref:hypothetical protein n=1 Tax=Polyangium jinanense TaxID=2829994 RepID=UPI002341246A|nr:hypothetical protein [Polyangium jinanense]MDC3961409.1 hypothetical protein [Polyangium jinanense]